MVTTRGKRSAPVTTDAVQPKKGSGRGRSTDPDDLKENTSTAKPISPGSDDFETVGSRLRKRRRIDSSNDDNQHQTAKRLTRHKDLSTDANLNQSELPTLDGSGEQPDLSENVQVDPRLSYNVSTRSQATNTDPDQSTIAGNALRRLQGTQRASVASNNIDLGGDPLFNDANHEARQPFIQSAAPDLSTVIESIIKHGETIDEHYAAKGLNEIGVVDTESFLPLGASAHLKIQSLPILENLSVQILNVLAKSTYREIVTITEDPDSEAGQAYATLKSLFDHTKKVYSVQEPFLSPRELDLTDRAQVETIRKANLATFVSSVFGGQDVGFYHLNEYFLDTFVGEGGRLLKNQGQLFLDLKTQAFISARSYDQHPKEELLNDIFPSDMEERLLARKGAPAFGSRLLAPSETEFLQRARNRSQALMTDPDFQDVDALSRRYAWEDFLRDISNYISKNFESLLGQPIQKSGPPGRTPNYFVPRKEPELQDVQRNEQPDNGQLSAGEAVNGIISHNNSIAPSDDVVVKGLDHPNPDIQGFGFHQGISLEDTTYPQAQQQSTSQDNLQLDTQPSEIDNEVAHGLPQTEPNTQYQYPPPPPHIFYNNGSFPTDQNLQPQFGTVPVNMNMQQQFYGEQPVNPHPTQSAPTQVLYERARQAATAKASPTNRRAGHPSQRRPWSHEEENALMAGLDRVKGPHWSQILAMFGPGGTINETLKDRNQVQLKDKARNLKLFFLKSGIEVPYYLQFVTGELKTRAPGQAAKNEAKEREIDSEERAHVEGVFTLAYGPDSVQDSDNNVVLDGKAGISGHGAALSNSGNQGMSMGDAEAEHTNRNDFSLHLANVPHGLPEVSYAPEANMVNYNAENPVTPNFQAMVDLAVAEAERVRTGGG